MNGKFSPILVAGSAIVAILSIVWIMRMPFPTDVTRLATKLITIETAHIATLAPHQHASRDAVSDPGHHEEVFSTDFIVQEDFSITDVAFDILNAPQAIVHHAALVSYSCGDSACTTRVSRELFRYGQDTMHYSHGVFPVGYMVPLHKGEHLLLSLAVHNPAAPLGTGSTYHDIFGRIELQENSVRARGALPVKFVHLFAEDECNRNSRDEIATFTVPAHARHYVYAGCGAKIHASTTFPSAGTIVHMGAHLHGWQGGKEVIVEKNGKPFKIFSTAVSPDDAHRYDTPYTQVPVHVAAGDTLSVKAVYDNPHDVPLRGAMGMFGFYITQE